MRLELPFIAGLALCATSLYAAGVALECAYYHVDIGGQYAWSEGAPGLADFASQSKRAGLLKVYLRNDSPAPAHVDALSLDGTPLADLRNNERHEVIWWRTWPNPIPPGQCAEVSVRLRYPLEQDGTLALSTPDGEMSVTVPLEPPPFRIETVAWPAADSVLLVAQKIGEEDCRIVRVFLDGKDVTASSKLPAPEFFEGVCPVRITAPADLTPGSFHTYRLEDADGRSAACTLRTLEPVLRLGMYGASDLERNIKLGLNTASHFGTQSRSELDRYAAYGMRNAFHVNHNPPAPEVRGHPAVHAYVLHDEPDCWDYSADEWPMPMRIGFHAPDIVAHTKQCAEADPLKPVQVTLDLTFKPANYFVYAQIPDIVTPDCYPLTVGQPITWVRDVTEVCRSAAGPRRVEMVPQVDFEDRQNVEMKFRRPPFAPEVTIQYLYALGGGARGFSGWEWFDEKADWCHFYGAPNFPDVLNAVATTYRRFKLLEPLILQAHRRDIVTCSQEKIWTSSLICGTDAMIVVAVNDDYESLPTDFVQTPKTDLRFTGPQMPWLRVGYAGLIEDGAIRDLALSQDAEQFSVELPRLETGQIMLLARDRTFADDLLARYTREQEAAGLALLRGARLDAERDAELEATKRFIMARYEAYRLDATKNLHAYGVTDEGFMNPEKAQYPAMEWWTEETPRGGEWTVTIPEERAGVEHTVYFQMSRWWGGGHLRVEVQNDAGEVVADMDEPTWTGPVPNVRVTFPTAGEHRLRILQAGEGKPGGRLNRSVWVVPANAPGLPGDPWD